MSNDAFRLAYVRASSGPRDAIVWDPETFARPSEAQARGRTLVAEGKAAVAFVVAEDGAGRRVLRLYTQPPSVRRVLDHYHGLLDQLSEGQP